MLNLPCDQLISVSNIANINDFALVALYLAKASGNRFF